MEQLSAEERLRLIRFVCSFVWADLEVQDQERQHVFDLVDQLELTEEERRMVQGWLSLPPAPDDIDPTDIPREHRQVFIDAVQKAMASDGTIQVGEAEQFHLFEQLLEA